MADRRPSPPKAKSPKKPKKETDAPKPPDLVHIPKLLPLFVEMVRSEAMPPICILSDVCAMLVR